MADRVNFPDDGDREPRTITDGFFEREVYLSRQQTAAFLRELADQIETDTSLVISATDWEIPFEYSEPIEVEIEFTRQRERELEIELEFSELNGDRELSVR